MKFTVEQTRTVIMSKQQTQQVLKDLRTEGYNVDKVSPGHYEVKLDGVTIFWALIGTRAYLVRFDTRLFPEA